LSQQFKHRQDYQHIHPPEPHVRRRRTRDHHKKHEHSKLISWSPVLIGCVISIFAPDLLKLAMQYPPYGTWAIFPFVLVSGRPELGLSEEMTRQLPQVMLYLQFPLEGLLSKLTLDRGHKLRTVIGQIFFLHFVGALVNFLLSMSGNS